MYPEDIARKFHEAYEELAPDFGYETREASRKPWGEVPENNRLLMTAVVRRLLEEGVIHMSEPIAVENISLRTEHNRIVVAITANGAEHDIITEPWPFPETEGQIYHSVTGIGMKAIQAGLKV